MFRFPVDATRDRVIKVFERLGSQVVREGNYWHLAATASAQALDDGIRLPLHLCSPRLPEILASAVPHELPPG
jgi:hypothetical protein